tara:strand:- start:162 stop:1034 length:873 start_codon:yes stop_codon:yes gene_type:complete
LELNPELGQDLILKSFYDWCQNPNRETLVMGILNVTPDSFSDGGLFYNTDEAVSHALQLIEDGIDIIDIGGESTRPGAEKISEEEEIQRTIPVVKQIRELSSEIIISIDTTKPIVAQKAIQYGANIINDISGFSFDNKMIDVVRESKVPVIIMHMQGEPSNMQNNPVYDDLIIDISSFFKSKIKLAIDAGIKKEQIILDPGIGFGKTVSDNFQLINQLNEFCKLGLPIMIGPSRKSFIGTTLDLPVDDRLEGTAAAVAVGVMNGARIVRVHDVKEIKRVVTIVEKIRTAA